MHNGVVTRTRAVRAYGCQCARDRARTRECDCQRRQCPCTSCACQEAHAGSAASSPLPEQSGVDQKYEARSRRSSPDNGCRVSLACCALPLRRRARNVPVEAQPEAAPPELASSVTRSLACVLSHDDVISSYLKISRDALPDKTVCFLRSIKFDNFMWTDQQLLLMTQWMFRDLQLLEEFAIDLQVFNRWLCTVYRHYNPVPYHNFNHAFMVVQMVYALIHQLRLTRHYSKLEQLTLLTAALVHDLDHPGLNTAYLINARSSLALLYNDISPLENHHCATTFQILNLPQCNILSTLTRDQYTELRSTLVRCVLATDMAKHFEICAGVQKMLFEPTNNQCVLDWSSKEHRLNMDVLLIKWADISNEVRPLEVATKWTDCLLTEFFRQGDLEKELGLPLSPLMDRQKVTRVAAQVSFIEHMLEPLAELMVHIFPLLDNDFLLSLRGKVVYYKSLQNFEPAANQGEAKPAT